MVRCLFLNVLTSYLPSYRTLHRIVFRMQRFICLCFQMSNNNSQSCVRTWRNDADRLPPSLISIIILYLSFIRYFCTKPEYISSTTRYTVWINIVIVICIPEYARLHRIRAALYDRICMVFFFLASRPITTTAAAFVPPPYRRRYGNHRSALVRIRSHTVMH